MRIGKLGHEKRGSRALFLAETIIRGVVGDGPPGVPAGTRGVGDLTEGALSGHKRLGSRRRPRLGEDTISGFSDRRALRANRCYKAVRKRLNSRLQRRRQVDVMRVHARNRKEHVPGQLTLNTNYKLLIISLVNLPG